MEALPQETLDAIGELYRVAGAVLGSLDVRWRIEVVPDGFAGPEIVLRVVVIEGSRKRGYKLTISRSLIWNECGRLQDALIYRVRSLRDGIRRGAEVG